jgi:mannitol-specific phosphotransferase system IIBC component
MAEQQYEVIETNGNGKKAKINFEIFRGKFRAFMAWWVVNLAFLYLFLASFAEYKKTEYVGTIVGFLTGTAIAVILTFYFSGSQQVDEQTQLQQIDKLKQRLKEKDEEIASVKAPTADISDISGTPSD